MTASRSSIFDDGDIDVAGFKPKSGPEHNAPAKAEVRAVAEAANFRQREVAVPAPAKPKPPRRIYRTGRNLQFNTKITEETRDAFYAICDQTGWVLGEALEHAVKALKEKLDRQSKQ